MIIVTVVSIHLVGVNVAVSLLRSANYKSEHIAIFIFLHCFEVLYICAT